MGILSDLTGGIAEVAKDATQAVVAPVVAPVVGAAVGVKETVADAWDGANKEEK